MLVSISKHVNRVNFGGFWANFEPIWPVLGSFGKFLSLFLRLEGLSSGFKGPFWVYSGGSEAY